MKTSVIFSAIFMIIFASCEKFEIEKCAPECLEQKIDEFAVDSYCDDATVSEYVFQGETVYVFDHGTCGADITSEVLNVECNSLGFLGGIMGNTKINGEDFSSAEFIEVIWEK